MQLLSHLATTTARQAGPRPAPPRRSSTRAPSTRTAEAEFSDYGDRVDVLAPGVDIESADWRSNTGSRTNTGTSFAAPHVAGLALYLKAKEYISLPDNLKRRIIELSTKRKVSGIKYGAKNRVANNGQDGF